MSNEDDEEYEPDDEAEKKYVGLEVHGPPLKILRSKKARIKPKRKMGHKKVVRKPEIKHKKQTKKMRSSTKRKGKTK